MRHYIAFIGLILLTSCAGTGGTHPFVSDEPRVYIQGTYSPGSNVTLPRPRRGQILWVADAGFLVLKNKGAVYYLRAQVPIHHTSTYYVRVEYDNPQDATHPFTSDLDLTPEMNSVLVTSPDVVWGIHNYSTYLIRVSVFADREGKQPIDSIVQRVRAYVDTTTGTVRVYNGMMAD